MKTVIELTAWDITRIIAETFKIDRKKVDLNITESVVGPLETKIYHVTARVLMEDKVYGSEESLDSN